MRRTVAFIVAILVSLKLATPAGAEGERALTAEERRCMVNYMVTFRRGLPIREIEPEARIKCQTLPAQKALDFLVDSKSQAGRLVHVLGCTIILASASSVLCNVRVQGRPVGNVLLDGDSMAREDLRRALNECAGGAPRPACHVDLRGRVRVNATGDVWVDDSSLVWR